MVEATYAITFDDLVGFFVRGTDKGIQKDTTIHTYKAYVYNIATVLLVYGVARALFSNALTHLAKAAVGYFFYTIAERDLTQIEGKFEGEGSGKEKARRVFAHVNAKFTENETWRPVLLSVCGLTVFRYGLPSNLQPADQLPKRS